MYNQLMNLDRYKTNKIIRLILIIIIFFLISFLIHEYGLANLREKTNLIGLPIYLLIFLLRSSSILFPALPSTGYSIFAGVLLGFKKAYPLICLADLISCSISFYLSKRFGKNILKKITSPRLVDKIELFGKNHLEENYLLIISFLMTGFFDFVCYGLGLTKATWKKFLPCLIISIIISNAPIVAFGSGLLDDGKKILILGVLGLLILSYINKKINLRKIF
tara:strand:+ start:3373 stop:4035 length:663 start_codon:yes stop_codon:yes gene_type:complete